MKISKKQIEDVSKLAKLEIDEKAVDIYASQLSGVFEYMEQLSEIDISILEPTAQVTGLENVTRNDEAEGCDPLTIKDALNQGELKDNQIKVPRILQ